MVLYIKDNIFVLIKTFSIIFPDIPSNPNTQHNTLCGGRFRLTVYFSTASKYSGTIATLYNYNKYITLKTKQFESQNHNELTLSQDKVSSI